MKKRNWIIAVEKMIFSVCIICMHCNVPFRNNSFMIGAYIFVDFFFIIQGYYLYFRPIKVEEPMDEIYFYVKDRLKRFFPCVMVGVFFYSVVYVYIGYSIDVTYIVGSLTELTFTSMLFPFYCMNMGTLWFVSASIIAGATVLGLLCKFKEKILVFIPFITILIYNKLFVSFGSLDVWMQTIDGIILAGFFRAFSGILSGVLCGYISRKLKDSYIKKCRWIIYIFTSGITAFCIYLASHYFHCYDLFYIILFLVFVVVANLEEFTTNNWLISRIDEIVMPMYIFQMPIILLMQKIMGNRFRTMLLTILLDIVISSVWCWGQNKIRNRGRIKKMRIMQ